MRNESFLIYEISYMRNWPFAQIDGCFHAVVGVSCIEFRLEDRQSPRGGWQNRSTPVILTRMSKERAGKQEPSARTRTQLPTGAGECGGGEPAASYLDRPNYVPGYLIRLANAMSRGGSRVYLKLYGVGVNEWRMLSMLAIDPGLLAKQICDTLELDKAAASRSVKTLLELGLVRSEPSGPNQRSRCLFLTAQGLALHDRILALALERERYLLAGISQAERETILSLLTRMTENLDALSAFEDRRMADAALPRTPDAESGN